MEAVTVQVGCQTPIRSTPFGAPFARSAPSSEHADMPVVDVSCGIAAGWQDQGMQDEVGIDPATHPRDGDRAPTGSNSPDALDEELDSEASSALENPPPAHPSRLT